MKYLSSRDLRDTPGTLKDQVRDEDVVLTANGRPVAVVIGVAEGDIEETLAVIRQTRAMRAVSRMRRDACEQGADKLSEAEVEREIRAARAERHRSRGSFSTRT